MEGDLNFAADEFLHALAADPASLNCASRRSWPVCWSDGPRRLQLARNQPDNQTAQMLLADHDAANGKWAAAESRFDALPRKGLTESLQPLLVAWAQAGAGHTDAALATLRPFIEGSARASSTPCMAR